MTTVNVGLGERAYDILIGDGLIGRAGSEIAARLPGIRVAVVTDENVAAAHLAALTASLDAAGIGNVAVTLPAGEKTKSFAALQRRGGRASLPPGSNAATRSSRSAAA